MTDVKPWRDHDERYYSRYLSIFYSITSRLVLVVVVDVGLTEVRGQGLVCCSPLLLHYQVHFSRSYMTQTRPDLGNGIHLRETVWFMTLIATRLLLDNPVNADRTGISRSKEYDGGISVSTLSFPVSHPDTSIFDASLCQI